MQPALNQTRVTGATEVLLSATPARIIAIIPEATTTGTVAIRDAAAIGGGSTPMHNCAIGLLQAGKQFAEWGVRLGNGLTVQLSVGGDAVTVVWGPLL
jgi:hypothetical protein